VYRRYKAKNYNIGTKPQTGRRPGVKIQAYCRVCLAACCSRNARSYMTWGKGARKAEGAPRAPRSEKREARSFLVGRLGRKKVDHHSLRRSGDYGRATKVPSGKWFPRCNKESPGQIQTQQPHPHQLATTATALARLAIAAPGGRWGGGCSV
jgi:hypothetical protein